MLTWMEDEKGGRVGREGYIMSINVVFEQTMMKSCLVQSRACSYKFCVGYYFGVGRSSQTGLTVSGGEKCSRKERRTTSSAWPIDEIFSTFSFHFYIVGGKGKTS